MEDSEFLKRKQIFVINKITSIMKNYPQVKYDIKFRNGKKNTAGTILYDPKTHLNTFIFSNYWIVAMFTTELVNLIKHECAHAISDAVGHGEKFKKICNDLKCQKRWQTRSIKNMKVYGCML